MMQGSRQDPNSQVRWMVCSNQFAGVIPAYAAMKVIGVDSNGFLQVTQPDADGMDVVINDGVNIPQNGFGTCTRDFPANVLYNQPDGTPNNGEVWGPAANDWALHKAKSGFLIDGAATAQAPFIVLAKHQFGAPMTVEYDDGSNVLQNILAFFFSKLDFIISSLTLGGLTGAKIQTKGLTQSLPRVTNVT